MKMIVSYTDTGPALIEGQLVQSKITCGNATLGQTCPPVNRT